jgi:hypothetical protein
MLAITGRAASRRLEDPAESWELDCSESESASYYRGVYDVFPRTPRREEEVPPGALEALNASCSLAGLGQLLLVPMAVRATGHGGEKVIAPASVLAVGNRAVGLWTEKPQAGVKVLIPLDRLSAIEDVTILLYGRLSFFSFTERLTIRYNTLARPSLKPVRTCRSSGGACCAASMSGSGRARPWPFASR